MESPGGPSSSTASAVRRSAGALRGSRIQSGRLTPQLQDEGIDSFTKAKPDTDEEKVKENEFEESKIDGNIYGDSTLSKEYDVWDPNDFVGTSNSALTPPGAMNKLPSISLATLNEVQNKDENAPWMRSTPRSLADYDWANFVYAYSRGRWDPSLLPQPPSQSNLYPGTSTRISAVMDERKKQAPNEAVDQEISERIRRPSLEYVHRPHMSNRVSSEPDRAFTNIASKSPSMMNIGPLFESKQRSSSFFDDLSKSEGSRAKANVQSLKNSIGQEKEVAPAFIDPFRIVKMVSTNSAPEVGQLAELGDLAQRVIDRDNKNAVDEKKSGSKTDTIVVTRNSINRLPSDPSHRRDTSNEARVLSGQAEALAAKAEERRTSTQSSSSSTALAPSTSASAIAATRPVLAAQMSELTLNASHTSRGNDVPRLDSSSSIPTNKKGEEEETEAASRPAPLPLQSQKNRISDSEEQVTSSKPPVDSNVQQDRRVALTENEREKFEEIVNDPGNAEAKKAVEEDQKAMTAEDTSHPEEQNACLVDVIVPSSSTRASSGGTGAGNGSLRQSIHVDEKDRNRRTSEAFVQKMPVDISTIGPSVSSPSLSTHIGLGRRVEEFYRKNGYLPAIMPPDEGERRQALRRYGPPTVRGNVNFERIAHLVKLVFNTKLVLISLVGEDTQFFQTEVGAKSLGYSKDWLQKVAAPRDCSMCAHAILQSADEPLVVLDTLRDWRFAGNPLVTGDPHIRFYAGTPLRTNDGHNLGSLCVIDDKPWSEFNPRLRHTLREFGRVVMREMELIRDTIHLRTQDRMQHSIESFTRECIEMESTESEDDKEHKQGLHQAYALAAKSMHEALQATGAIVFDLSQFELMVPTSEGKTDEDGTLAGNEGQIFLPSSPYHLPDSNNTSSREQSNVNSRAPSPPNVKDFNAQPNTQDERKVPPMAVLGACESHAPPATREQPIPISSYHRIANFLRKHRTGFFYPYVPAPFRHFLPGNTANVLLVPIFGLNRQPFALLCAYSRQTDDGPTLEDFKESGLQYLRAMGTIILSAILKKDIMLADKAKSHFISNISHELRTPLHGILAAAELLNETKLNSTQGSYLETVEACGKSLLELVNHVLDFTKLSGNFHAKQNVVKPSQRCDLVKLVQEVCESSWIGQMAKNLESKQNAGIGSAYAHGSEVSSSRSSLDDAETKIPIAAGYNNLVETVIDVSMRTTGWLVKCDAGGIRRVLMNLIGNSLKFTTKGFVHVSLREVQSSDTHVLVELGVTDTGKGISRSFLEEQLFHPFTQENHLGPGTGLGLSIVNSIVQSPAINGKIDVWSTVGQGTEIRVTCELELCKEDETEGPIYRPFLNVEHQRSVSFLGFDEDLRGQSDLKDVLRSYFEDWWRFQFLDDVEKGDMILINDDLSFIRKILDARSSPLPPIILLTGARGSSVLNELCDEYQQNGGVVRLLFKPAGPAKLEAVTDFCLQCFERGQAGLPMIDVNSAHTTPLPSPAISREGGERKDYFAEGDKTANDDAVTPRGPPAISTSVPKDGKIPTHHRSASRPDMRPKLSNDLRRNSHHISPGPPTSSDSALIRRHSSEGRTGKQGGGSNKVVSETDGSIHTSSGDAQLSTGHSYPRSTYAHGDGLHSAQSNSSGSSQSSYNSTISRPLMPTRSITYHEPRLQRHVLMSPLRNDAEAMDYFGPAAYQTSYNQTSASSNSSNPNSPGSVISLEGGDGAVLRTAIHTAGLMRHHVQYSNNAHLSTNSATGNGGGKKRLQVLSVEDNSINRKVLAAFFAKMDVDLVEATNGEEGVRTFEAYGPFHFDVIFMDLSMPVLDGIGAMTQIRKIEAERFKNEQSNTMAWIKNSRAGNALTGGGNSQTNSTSNPSTSPNRLFGTPGGSRPSAQARSKIFALTGRSSDEDKRRAFAMGADGFIVKPLSYKVLSSLIHTISAYKNTVPSPVNYGKQSADSSRYQRG